MNTQTLSLPNKFIATSVLIAITMMALAPMFVAADTTVVVSGDTSAGENQPGWLFNRDVVNATPIEFSTDEASIGDGSLYVLPIDGDIPDRKFIGENFLNTAIADVDEISYDFMIGAGGDSSDENEFYMNVYANFGTSSDLKFFDCVYNVVPSTGSTTAFTTVTFDPDQAYPLRQSDSSPFTCPAIPADMDDLSGTSTIRMFAINLGDTTNNDADLDGYFDNVVVTIAGEATTYDFEPEAEFEASLTITNPDAGETVGGVVILAATYVDEDGDDSVQWALRAGSCSAGTGTVAGNVDGFSTPYAWDGEMFSASVDMSDMADGTYCFVVNPTEDAGDDNLRATQLFTLDNEEVEEPEPGDITKEQCKAEWSELGFKNQGQCIRFAQTGKDSR